MEDDKKKLIEIIAVLPLCFGTDKLRKRVEELAKNVAGKKPLYASGEANRLSIG